MSTEMSNPDGVVMLKDTATCGEPQPVLIDFDDGPVEPGTKHQILRVLVGPGPGLDVTRLREFSKNNKPNKDLGVEIASSCDSGKASVIFLKEENEILVENLELSTKAALVGITKIKNGQQKYPQEIVYSEAFYTFSPANRKAFAKLFCQAD